MVIYPFFYHKHIIGILNGSSEYSQYTALVAENADFVVLGHQRGRAAYMWIQSYPLFCYSLYGKNNHVKLLVT